MNNGKIAVLFEELADIMEIAGENYFKIKAYRNAYVTISHLPQWLDQMPSEKIIDIPGIGKAIYEKIQAALKSGTFPTLEKWRQNGFASFRPLLAMPDMNMRKLRTLIKSFNLSTIEDLKNAVFGEKRPQSNAIDENIRMKLMTFMERIK